nr:endothelin-converting enzyme homolog [Lepeophtheirus salmonis]
MIVQIKKTFKNFIREKKYLKKLTKNSMIKKIDEMEFNVGVPNWMMSKMEPSTFYEKLFPLYESKFLENMMKMYEFTNLVRVLKKEVYPGMSPFDVDCFNILSSNTIGIGISYIEKFYDSRAPGFYNYGALGTAIAHEIGHGFDLKGRSFELIKQDNIEIIEPIKYYCLNQQLKSYYKKMLNTPLIQRQDNLRVINENLADNIGVIIGYKAYFNSYQRLEDDLFYGSLYSRRMYFISYAQKYCGNKPTDIFLYPPLNYRGFIPLWNFRTAPYLEFL